MLNDTPGLAELLDRELIAFLTAINEDGQPQTSPVWFVRDGEDLIVYNQPSSPRFASIAAHPKVAFNLRGDVHGHAVITLEGEAVAVDLPPATEFPGYLGKYRQDIEDLGWTPEQFASDYRAGIRITVTRVRAHGLDRLGE
jgi:PPOX class probable F420-dependent enzyme